MNDLPAAPPCERAISEETARQVYDRLVAIKGSDDCVLDDVSTKNSQMVVRWTTKGIPLPVAEISPRECAPRDAVAGPALAVRIPDSLRATCPATAEKTIATIQRESFGGLTKMGGAPGAFARWRPLAIGLGFLAAVVLIVVLERRRRRTGAPAP